MAEVAVSMLIIGVMLPAVLSTLSAAKLGQHNNGNRRAGSLLAQSLMSEVLLQSYEDPDGTPVFGAEPTEGTLSRANFDDVDDYNAWSASPPQWKDGTALPDRNGWRRAVTVDYVNPDNLTQTSASDLGVKRITVTVTYNEAITGSVVAIRTRAAGLAGVPIPK